MRNSEKGWLLFFSLMVTAPTVVLFYCVLLAPLHSWVEILAIATFWLLSASTLFSTFIQVVDTAVGVIERRR